ncbi:hypothetical protein Tco_1290768 [Tanacetum coccineum]
MRHLLTTRTFTCAPTNIVVVGVTKRLMSLMRNSLVYDTYGLRDIVLFGNGGRMKIDEHNDLLDIFLDKPVKMLHDCLAPFSGWKENIEAYSSVSDDNDEIDETEKSNETQLLPDICKGKVVYFVEVASFADGPMVFVPGESVFNLKTYNNDE